MAEVIVTLAVVIGALAFIVWFIYTAIKVVDFLHDQSDEMNHNQGDNNERR